jgi:glycosyltransferase involved in cell wall biosynthesis
MTTDLSVVMPVRDAAEYISAAIHSVLDNAEGLQELIVVDNGSVDGSGEIATAFGEPVRVVRKEPGGPSSARNLGLELARGSLIGFLDSDDLWVARAPDPRRAALAADHTLDVAMGRLQAMAAAPDGTLHDVMDPFPAAQMGSGLYRREVFDRVGPLDPARDHAEDVDWFLRARHAGAHVTVLDDVVLRYRLRPGSLTRDRKTSQSAALAALHAAIQRRRRVQA